MNNWDELRRELIRFVQNKFRSRPQIAQLAEDIADEAITDVLSSKGGTEEKLNFGYLSKACIHRAYKLFQKLDSDNKAICSIEFLDEAATVDEIIKSEDTDEILNSLDVLKQIERVIIVQRYYGDFSFAQIAEANGIKLSTVFSHHRRALEKLRPRLLTFADGRKKYVSPLLKSDMTNGFSKLF